MTTNLAFSQEDGHYQCYLLGPASAGEIPIEVNKRLYNCLCGFI